MKILLLGAPGAGKGTQAEYLSKKLGIPTISTGNILREAVKNATPIGMRAKSYMDAGALVPDDVIIGLFADRVSESDCDSGYILDGIPRTLTQARALEDGNIEIDTAVNIEISDDTIISRMSGRRVCPECGATFHIDSAPPKIDGICDHCGVRLIIRKDDERDTVRNRLRVFHEETEPLLEFYKSRGKLISVLNLPSIDAMSAAVAKALGLE